MELSANRTKNLFFLLVFMILFSISSKSSQAIGLSSQASLKFPFRERGFFPWKVHDYGGYNNAGKHQGYQEYSLDLITQFNADETAGQVVLAPVSGTFVHYDPNDGCFWIRIDKLYSGSEYYFFMTCHIEKMFSKGVNSYVNQGEVIGVVQDGNIYNNYEPHIHITFYRDTNKVPKSTLTRTGLEFSGPLGTISNQNFPSNNISNEYGGKENLYSLNYPHIAGDANDDDSVNILDYTLLFENYGWSGSPGSNLADFNEDGEVDILDYIVLFENFGESVILPSTMQNKSESLAQDLPTPPSNARFEFEQNISNSAVFVKLLWDENSTNEDGFDFNWVVGNLMENDIRQVNEERPPPPEGYLVELLGSSVENSSSVITKIPCRTKNETYNISASVSAFNATGNSSEASNSGIIEVQSCPNYLYLPILIQSTNIPPRNNPPEIPNSPSPPHGALDQNIDINLNWSGGDPNGDSVNYDVYLEANQTTPTNLVCNNITVTSCEPGMLNYGTNYYWKVIATDEYGDMSESPIWNFSTEPEYIPPTWIRRYPTTSPSARSNHKMAYDGDRGFTVLFGGDDGTEIQSDTWEWDGTTWTQRTPSTSPPARYNHALAYDSTRKVVVLFGGRNNGLILGDTWEWDGANWTQRTPPISPPARWIHSMAYDSARGVVVLFGGSGDCGGSCNDTWEWNGTTWTQLTPTTSPPHRWGHNMAYDSTRGVTVLFGGRNNAFPLQNTWEWNGTTWKQYNSSPIPSVRDNSTLVFDSARGITVLFGGFEAGVEGYYLGDTWEWDGTAWTETSPSTSPEVRDNHAMVYDSIREVTVLFGGNIGDWPSVRLNDTWEYGQLTY